MGNRTSDLNKIGFRKERGPQAAYAARYSASYRVGYGGVQATPVAIPATDCLGWDKTDGEIDIPEPMRNKEELNVIGDGPKTADIVEMGFETVEQTYTVNAQTGIYLYYVLGGVVTDGTDLGTPITDSDVTRASATSIGGFTGLTVDAHIGRIARVTNGTYSGWVWTITDNDATTLTVNTTLPTDFATSNTGSSPTVEILASPFTHTISESPAAATQVASGSQVYLPSFIIHTEDSDGTNVKVRDLLGCLVKTLKITIEKGAKVMFEVTVLVPKSMVGLVQTTYPTYALSGDTRAALSYPTDEVYGWFDFNVATSCFGYGVTAITADTVATVAGTTVTLTNTNTIAANFYAGDILVITSGIYSGQYYPITSHAATSTSALELVVAATPPNFASATCKIIPSIFGTTQTWFNELGKIEITIDHPDLEVAPIQGDPYSFKILNGKLDYTVAMTYYPNSDEITENEFDSTAYRLLYALKQMKLSEYDGNLAMVIRLQRSATDYLQLTFSSLYVTAYPDKLSTISEKQVSIDMEMKNAPTKGSVTQGSLVGVVVDDRNSAYYGDT